MNNLRVTMSYKGRIFDFNGRVIALTLLGFVLFCIFFLISFILFFDNIKEVEQLKKQLMVERTINSTLSREINESGAKIAKIAKSIAEESSSVQNIPNKNIVNKIQLYSIFTTMQENLSIIDKHLSQKVSKFRGILNVAKVNNSEVLHGINLTQFSSSVSAKQNPNNIQKAGIGYQNAILSSINQSIVSIFTKQKGLKILQQYVSSMPLGSPIADGRFVSGYGVRNHPIYHKEKMHYGVDFAGSYRAKILSTGEGIVEKAIYNGGYGNHIVVRHKNNVKTLYAHMSVMKVRAGQKVKAGSVLGLQGSTGNSTGAHVHYEIMINGKHIDPLDFIRAKSLL